MNPVQHWFLQFLAGACRENSHRLLSSPAIRVWETRIQTLVDAEHVSVLAWTIHRASEGSE